MQEISTLFSQIEKGERTALGKAMTLVESELPADRELAVRLLMRCEEKLKHADPSIRFTISGAPGAGKSSLIEALGTRAIEANFRVGVITVDPSSTISHGSILGDKARMPNLSGNHAAFIRSSPAGTLLGGIGRRSRELMTLLTVAGYNLIFLETVGVGQSEHIAWQLTDGFILVVQPGAGDELQGIKRGITELADIILVNKADADLEKVAVLTKSHYQNAVHYLTPLRKNWEPKVLTCSALEGTGIDDSWEVLRSYRDLRLRDDTHFQDRKRQDKFWLSWTLEITAKNLLLQHPTVNQKLREGLLKLDQDVSQLYQTEFEIESAMKQLIRLSNEN